MASQVHDFHVKDVFEEIYKHDENYGEPGRRPKRAPETGIDILIVGAGYSGLVAAMECWRKGHNVLPILERSEYPVCNGDALIIQPSAMTVFRHWPDVWEACDREGYDCLLNYRKYTGELIYGPAAPQWNDPENKAGRVGPNVPFAQNRVKLYKTFLRQVDRLGVKIEWGKKAVEYFEDASRGEGGIVLHDASKRTADVVIAADGVKSTSSTLINVGNERPRPSGTSIYRCAYPVDIAMKDPLVHDFWPHKADEKPIWEFWMGPGVHIVMCISHDIAIWGLTHGDHADQTTSAETWGPSVTPEEVIKVLSRDAPGFHPAVPALMRTAPRGSIVHWKSMWRDLREDWTSLEGRVLQIGDSAHTLLTASGNGATQAIEDAVSIAACLQLAGKSHANLATKISNRLRYERVSCAQKMGFVNSQMKHATDWKKIEKEPAEIRTRLPKWVYKHDPEVYAYKKFGEAFDHVVNGAVLENTNFPRGHNFRSWTIDEVKEEIAKGARIDELLDGDWS